MFQYMKNTMGIKEKIDLEHAMADVRTVDEISGEALVDLGDISSGNMDAAVELGDIACGNMDAIAELGAMISALEARVAALEGN